MIRDRLNIALSLEYASKTKQQCHFYHAHDRLNQQPLHGEQREHMWRVKSSVTRDTLGKLPLVHGIKVMVTENIAICKKIVNGSEGTLHSLHYTTDEDGNQYAAVAYIHVPLCGMRITDLPDDVVPIFPVRSSFQYKSPNNGPRFTISRTQLPLVPAYSYTDYKSQGRSLSHAIVDLASAKSLQGVYVMLSRVRNLKGLAVLRWVPPQHINQRLSEEIRDELTCIQYLHEQTMTQEM
ncbi:hypothetical protein PUNSTDRAFT_72032 [Punctularia strigosozonata HHB-11173 SS5]|uniref:uncharacterized protein n=1 Tax=Punctularia strigosozonata (strain HHB-11173) TaxID=741275 RepID=UPI00044166D1|nr:uncharacterized protein PUNSTDRAFT_72032 [Punctularia strigosozonata HHB-11173 SS5]EIN06868.1 hypothetical protein PUNSTDRAFT_72032 [Punctularia strigosozonata HHB-11173 SS5]